MILRFGNLAAAALLAGAVTMATTGCEGRPAEIVPDVAGMSSAEALAALEAQDIDAPYDHEWMLLPPYDTLPLAGTEPVAGSEVRAPWRVERFEFAPLTVTGVLDGTTIDLSTGERLRLIGIVPPSPGACGAAEATAALTEWVLGKEIYVENPVEVPDRDEAGNLLAYIGLEGVNDVGYQMILSGTVTLTATDHPAAYIYEPGFARAEAYSCNAPPEQPETSQPLPASPATQAWECRYVPTMNENWHDDVLCQNGAEKIRPLLREWDGFIEEWEMREEAEAYERSLNGG